MSVMAQSPSGLTLAIASDGFTWHTCRNDSEYSTQMPLRRPTPLDARLAFDLDRQTDGQRITSEGRLFRGDENCLAGTIASQRLARP